MSREEKTAVYEATIEAVGAAARDSILTFSAADEGQQNETVNSVVTTYRTLADDQINGPRLAALFDYQLGVCVGGAPTPAESNWMFAKAAWFAFTVMTTIGYGTFTPATTPGQWLVLLYGTATIVLYGMLARPCERWVLHLTDRAAAAGLRLLHRTSGSARQGRVVQPASSPSHTLHARAIAATALCYGLMAATATLAHVDSRLAGRQWSFGTCFYFVFVTFSSIGLGDLSRAPTDGDVESVAILLVQVGVVHVGMASFKCFIALSCGIAEFHLQSVCAWALAIRRSSIEAAARVWHAASARFTRSEVAKGRGHLESHRERRSRVSWNATGSAAATVPPTGASSGGPRIKKAFVDVTRAVRVANSVRTSSPRPIGTFRTMRLLPLDVSPPEEEQGSASPVTPSTAGSPAPATRSRCGNCSSAVSRCARRPAGACSSSAWGSVLLLLALLALGAAWFLDVEASHEAAVAQTLRDEENGIRVLAGLGLISAGAAEPSLAPPANSSSALLLTADGARAELAAIGSLSGSVQNDRIELIVDDFKLMIEHEQGFDSLSDFVGSKLDSCKQAPPSANDLHWSWSGAVFFAMTVMTTIGYGKSPVTRTAHTLSHRPASRGHSPTCNHHEPYSAL